MKENTIINQDCRLALADISPESINCSISSPPYLSLRDYGLDPTIWDGDKKCRHKWGNEKKIKYSGGVGKTDVGYFADDKTHFQSQEKIIPKQCLKNI